MFKMLQVSKKKEKISEQERSLANMLVNHILLAEHRPTSLSSNRSQPTNFVRKTFS